MLVGLITADFGLILIAGRMARFMDQGASYYAFGQRAALLRRSHFDLDRHDQIGGVDAWADRQNSRSYGASHSNSQTGLIFKAFT